MSNSLLLFILLLVSICAVLSGIAVFSNSRPPDPRVNLLVSELDEVKGLVSQLQKAILSMDRKLEKEIRENRTEQLELLNKLLETFERIREAVE